MPTLSLPPNPPLASLSQLLPGHFAAPYVDDTMLPSRISSTTHSIAMPRLLLFMRDSNPPPALFSSDDMSCHCQSMSSGDSMISSDPRRSDSSPFPSQMQQQFATSASTHTSNHHEVTPKHHATPFASAKPLLIASRCATILCATRCSYAPPICDLNVRPPSPLAFFPLLSPIAFMALQCCLRDKPFA